MANGDDNGDTVAALHAAAASQSVALAGRISSLRGDLAHVRELLTQRMDKEELALDKQAREYERRLTDLNHAHEQAREKEKDFLSRTEYTVMIREIEKKTDTNSDAILALSNTPADIRGLYAWKEEMGKVVVTLAPLSAEVKSLSDFKYDVANWRSKVIGMSMGVGAVCGVLGGIISAAVGHWMK